MRYKKFLILLTVTSLFTNQTEPSMLTVDGKEMLLTCVKCIPEYTYRKIKTLQPQTVTVPHIEMEPDKELKQQLILPESELQPLDLE